jgi:hypothetical protein
MYSERYWPYQIKPTSTCNNFQNFFHICTKGKLYVVALILYVHIHTYVCICTYIETYFELYKYAFHKNYDHFIFRVYYTISESIKVSTILCLQKVCLALRRFFHAYSSNKKWAMCKKWNKKQRREKKVTEKSERDGEKRNIAQRQRNTKKRNEK